MTARAGDRQRRLRRLRRRREAEIGRLARRDGPRSPTPGSRARPTRSTLLTSTGATIAHEIAAAAETPERRPRLLRADGAARALRRRDPGGARDALAAVRAPRRRRAGSASCSPSRSACSASSPSTRCSRGSRSPARARRRSAAPARLRSAPRLAYLALAAVDAGGSRARGAKAGAARRLAAARWPCWSRSASACTTSARASRSARPTRSARWRSAPFLVVGFAIHNTTEGLAIVAPLGRSGARAAVGRLALLGLLAGGPAVLGAWIGAVGLQRRALAAFLFGVGAGAIAQVIVQIAPGLRDAAGRVARPRRRRRASPAGCS